MASNSTSTTKALLPPSTFRRGSPTIPEREMKSTKLFTDSVPFWQTPNFYQWRLHDDFFSFFTRPEWLSNSRSSPARYFFLLTFYTPFVKCCGRVWPYVLWTKRKTLTFLWTVFFFLDFLEGGGFTMFFSFSLSLSLFLPFPPTCSIVAWWWAHRTREIVCLCIKWTPLDPSEFIRHSILFCSIEWHCWELVKDVFFVPWCFSLTLALALSLSLSPSLWHEDDELIC